jgi:cupin fold WbuC family metalloprotein
MNTVRSLSTEVLTATGSVVQVTAADIQPLIDRARHSSRRRARLCTHPGPADPLHEMLICLARDTYVRPHRHAGKSESFHLIAGDLAVVLFTEDGTIRDVIRMGPFSSGQVFFYRLMESCFHTVLVESEFALFHETTNGPFDPADTEFAPWAPAEGDPHAAEFSKQLRTRIRGGLA